MTASGHRIYVVEDHPIFREGLCELIESVPTLAVCGQADNLVQARDGIVETSPHLVIVDLQLRVGTGFSLIQDLLADSPTMRILVLSMFDEMHYAQRLLGLGVMGYVMKDEGPEVVLRAIQTVLSGARYASDRVKQAALTSPCPNSPLERLTERELEIFHLAGMGDGVGEIADALSRSPKTVQNHILSMQRKLGTASRQAFYQLAREWAPCLAGAHEPGKSPIY